MAVTPDCRFCGRPRTVLMSDLDMHLYLVRGS